MFILQLLQKIQEAAVRFVVLIKFDWKTFADSCSLYKKIGEHLFGGTEPNSELVNGWLMSERKENSH